MAVNRVPKKLSDAADRNKAARASGVLNELSARAASERFKARGGFSVCQTHSEVGFLKVMDFRMTLRGSKRTV